MNKSAGVSDIVISVPRLYIQIANRDKPNEHTEYSSHRYERDKDGKIIYDKGEPVPISPAKYLNGIGVAKMSRPDTYQDAVTLAANAVYELIERNNIRPKEINRIEIGTETGPDESKSIGMYVLGTLEKKLGKGSLKRCATPEGKAACASTAFAFENALDWIWSGRSNGSCRIICGTDIANYGLNSGGEPTQGAAAVAVLVKPEPKLLEFDKVIGQYTEDEGSFYRPSFSHVAFVNGKESEKKYMIAMREAFDHYAEQAIESGLISLKPGESLTDHFDLLSFHQPFPKMIEKAYSALKIHEDRQLPRWQSVVKEIGEKPEREDFETEEEYEIKEEEFRKKFRNTKFFQESFQAKMADGREFSIESGNSYTVSTWGHLQSLLSLKDKKGENLTGKRGGIGFFGSGCVAVGQSYTVLPGCQNVIRSFNLMEKLRDRTALSLQDYEDLHEQRPLSDGRKFVLSPEHEFTLTKIENGYRYYNFVE